MAVYQNAGATATALIEAAGELLAERPPEEVSVREITGKAGVKVNAISYHFGGKEGLVEAVGDYALSRWRGDRIGEYCRSHGNLLRSRRGSCRFIRGMISVLFETIAAEGEPLWINQYLLRTLIGNSSRKAQIAELAIKPLAEHFGAVFRRITGNADPDAARCWFMNIICSGGIFAANLSPVHVMKPGEPVDYRFFRKIQRSVTENALFAVGLQEP